MTLKIDAREPMQTMRQCAPMHFRESAGLDVGWFRRVLKNIIESSMHGSI